MKRCIIVGGAPINNYEYIISKFNKDDYFIYCDSGLKHLEKLKRNPNLIVGDFDSISNPNLNVKTIVLPCEKDDTDTLYGVKEALNLGFDSFLLIGVIGNRLDHTLGNLSILLMLKNNNKFATIIDDYSECEIITPNCKKTVEDKFSYFSILAISDIVLGVTIKNAKYCLNKAQITNSYAIGVSNEVIKGKTATISIEEGTMLLIKVF